MVGRSKIVTFGLPLIAAALLAWATYSIAVGKPDRPRVEPTIAPAAQPGGGLDADGELSGQGYIGAVGLVEPVGQQVDVGTNVPGVVTAVPVTVGDEIKQGDVLFKIDPRSAEAALALRRQEQAVAAAQVDELRGQAAALRAQVQAAEAAVNAAQADLDDAASKLKVAESVGDPRAISAEELTARRAAKAGTEAGVKQAQASLEQRKADLALLVGDDGGDGPSLRVATARVEQAKATVDAAQTDLDLHTVRSPITGRALQVNVRPGQYAVAGASDTALMVVGVVDPVHVRASIDEADLGRFKPGLPAVASPRGNAARRATVTFVRVEPLVVPKVSLTGAGGERVDTRVLQVIYAADPAELGAYVGQQVDLFIKAKPEGE